jgi:hypothetical protein
MAQVSPLAMLLSGIGSRGDVMPATDDQGNLVLVPKPGAGAQLPGGAKALPQQRTSASREWFRAARAGNSGQPLRDVCRGRATTISAGCCRGKRSSDCSWCAACCPDPTGSAAQFGALPKRQRLHAARHGAAQRDGSDGGAAREANRSQRPFGEAALVRPPPRRCWSGSGAATRTIPTRWRKAARSPIAAYNTAEYTRKQALEGDKEKLEQFDRGTRAQRENFQSQNDVFHDEMSRAQEERMRFDTTSKAGERSAKADKYDNTVDPSTIKQDKDGNWFGRLTAANAKRRERPKGYKDPNSDNDPEHVIMQNTPADKKVDVARRSSTRSTRAAPQRMATSPRRQRPDSAAAKKSTTPATRAPRR